jgi:hypothetical protein
MEREVNERSENNNKISQIENLLSMPLIFPERQERHIKSAPPREAYLFFPKGSDVIDYDEKTLKNTRRKIFEIKTEEGEYDYTSFEKEQLDLLRSEIEIYNSDPKNLDCPLMLGDNLKVSEVLRFLQSTSYDNKKTLTFLKDHLTWKKNYYPIKVNSKVEEILNSGFMYMHGRDNHFRPIVVVKAQKYLQLSQKFSLEDFVTAIIYFIEYLVRYCLLPGQIESWNIIADMRNVSIMFLPSDLMKMFSIFQGNYRARLCTVFVVGMNTIMNAIWSLVKKLIDAQTNKKVKFVKDINREEIFEFINKEQVEEMYGGTAKNLDESIGYFPPIVPCENFLKESDDRKEFLVSIEKYDEIYRSGRLNSVSPFFLEELNRVKINYDNKTIYTMAASEYEDAQSLLHIEDNSSVYENCRELKSTTGSETLNKIELENEFKNDITTPKNDNELKLAHDYLEENENNTYYQSMKEINKSKGKKEIDLKNTHEEESN